MTTPLSEYDPTGFILGQLKLLESDLERFGRLLDAMRRTMMASANLDELSAEVALMRDSPEWRQVRREHTAAQRLWLQFHRRLKQESKSKPAAEDACAKEENPPVRNPSPPAESEPPAPPAQVLPAPAPAPASAAPPPAATARSPEPRAA